MNKLEFQDSHAISIAGVSYINVIFSYGQKAIVISIPANMWQDTFVSFDGVPVDLNGVYDPIINKAIRVTCKMFPNWRV